MNTIKKRIWRAALIVAGSLAVVAVVDSLDEPPPAQIQVPMVNGYPAIPPAFNWNDMFRGPH
ncbi:hypothetical protein LJR289_000978 [Pseudoduganella sp. LjRoot289]|uniref:hypothetical protein n=1 Tax=Pseudoduganella sp. LjRoot289 TaxID=3342314 RepID=UPI003ED02C03